MQREHTLTAVIGDGEMNNQRERDRESLAQLRSQIEAYLSLLHEK
jgi:hypothetical protein